LISDQSAITQSSDVFSQFYAESAAGCKLNQDPKQCQVLANLCVLKLYNESSLECKLFREVILDIEDANAQGPQNLKDYEELGWTPGLPWLYYDQSP
jgi:hypothetical protein